MTASKWRQNTSNAQSNSTLGLCWQEKTWQWEWIETKADWTVEHAAAAASSSTACQGPLSCQNPAGPQNAHCCAGFILMWRYLICGFGGGGFGAGAELAPGQGKGADSALRPLRSCSSSCLPDWRAVDQPESSSLNTKPDSGKLPGAYCTQGVNSSGARSQFRLRIWKKVKQVKVDVEIFNLSSNCCHLICQSD